MVLFMFINFANALLSEMVLIYVALRLPKPYPVFAVVLLLGRFLHIYPSGVVCLNIIGRSKKTTTDTNEEQKNTVQMVNIQSKDTVAPVDYNDINLSDEGNWKGTTHYRSYLCTEHFFDNTRIYVALLIISCFDAQLLRYLPWLISPFSKKLGFPNYRLLNLVYKTKFLHLLFMWCGQVGLLILNKANNQLSEDKTVLIFVYMYLASLSFNSIYQVMVVLVQRGLLKEGLVKGHLKTTTVSEIHQAVKTKVNTEIKDEAQITIDPAKVVTQDNVRTSTENPADTFKRTRIGKLKYALDTSTKEV